MIESWPPLTSPDGSSNRNPPERCPCPLYSRDSAQEDQEIPQRDQDGNYVNIKVEAKEAAEDLYEQSDDPCRKEDVPPEISTAHWQSTTMALIDAETFIATMQRHPILHDISHPSYKDNHKKRLVWENITKPFVSNWEALDLNQRKAAVDTIKNRWRHMKDNYIRELRLQKTEAQSGAGASQRRIYTHFNALDFLRPGMQMRQTESDLDRVKDRAEPETSPNLPETPEMEGHKLASTVSTANASVSILVKNKYILDNPVSPRLVDRQQPSTSGNSTPNITSVLSRRRNSVAAGRKRARANFKSVDLMRQNLNCALQILVDRARDKELPYFYFGMSLAQMMERVPTERISGLQAKLVQVVYDFENGFQQPNMPQHHQQNQQYWANQYVWEQAPRPQGFVPPPPLVPMRFVPPSAGFAQGHAPAPSTNPQAEEIVFQQP